MKNNSSVKVCGIEKLDKGKYRISFETGIHCLVYGYEIRVMKLEEDTYISEEQYQHILREIVGKRAKKRAMHLLERMDRTEQQLREKLLASDYPEECVEDAIFYVKSFHYLDDSRYAENFTRYSKEKLSRQQIKQKLMTKGISRELIEDAIESEYDADERQHIRQLLEKKHFDSANCDEGEFRRIYQYILRRGFRSNDILKEMKSFQEPL